MKRKDFLGYTLMLAAGRYIPFNFSQDRRFSFNFSVVNTYLNRLPVSEQQTTRMMINNLLFDIEHIIQNGSVGMNMATLKSLAAEADRKFYTSNKIPITNSAYESLSDKSLELLKQHSRVHVNDFETMIRSIRSQIEKLKNMQEKIDLVLAEILAFSHSQAEKMKEAQGKEGCVKVISVITAVIIVVVAIVISIFSFGSGNTSITNHVLDATTHIKKELLDFSRQRVAGKIVVGEEGLQMELNNKIIFENKTKLNWKEVDEKIRCGIILLSRAVSMHYFSRQSYPANPLMGSVALSLVASSLKIPGAVNC